jgi:hypothetical protein
MRAWRAPVFETSGHESIDHFEVVAARHAVLARMLVTIGVATQRHVPDSVGTLGYLVAARVA